VRSPAAFRIPVGSHDQNNGSKVSSAYSADSGEAERYSEGKPNGIPGLSRTPTERTDAGNFDR